jgi:hypothetical protein
VLVSARRFTEQGIGSARELTSPPPVEASAHEPLTLELHPRQVDAA